MTPPIVCLLFVSIAAAWDVLTRFADRGQEVKEATIDELVDGQESAARLLADLTKSYTDLKHVVTENAKTLALHENKLREQGKNVTDIGLSLGRRPKS